MTDVPPKGYISEGKTDGAKTYGVTDGNVTLIQIQFPNGELGDIQELSWPIERWKGQMRAEPTTTLEPIPDELVKALDRY